MNYAINPCSADLGEAMARISSDWPFGISQLGSHKTTALTAVCIRHCGFPYKIDAVRSKLYY